jgi:hypothetical protein
MKAGDVKSSRTVSGEGRKQLGDLSVDYRIFLHWML